MFSQHLSLSFSVSQLPQWREVSTLHVPHSEMVHGKARGNFSPELTVWLTFVFLRLTWHFSSASQQRSNIPCHLQDISCGLTCNKTLPCENHRCRRICHRGECLTEVGCQQPCMLPRPACGHPCAAPCHKGSSCPRNPCTAKVQCSRTDAPPLDEKWITKCVQMVFVTSRLGFMGSWIIFRFKLIT